MELEQPIHGAGTIHQDAGTKPRRLYFAEGRPKYMKHVFCLGINRKSVYKTLGGQDRILMSIPTFYLQMLHEFICVCVKSACPILEATDQMLDEKRRELQDRTHDQNKMGDLANSVQHGNREREKE